MNFSSFFFFFILVAVYATGKCRFAQIFQCTQTRAVTAWNIHRNFSGMSHGRKCIVAKCSLASFFSASPLLWFKLMLFLSSFWIYCVDIWTKGKLNGMAKGNVHLDTEFVAEDICDLIEGGEDIAKYYEKMWPGCVVHQTKNKMWDEKPLAGINLSTTKEQYSLLWWKKNNEFESKNTKKPTTYWFNFSFNKKRKKEKRTNQQFICG